MPHFDVPSSNRRNARRMRRQMTDSELRFWDAVRAHRLDGPGFRRQLPISGYIADFACPALRLVIEIDGAGHTEDRMIRKDAERMPNAIVGCVSSTGACCGSPTRMSSVVSTRFAPTSCGSPQAVETRHFTTHPPLSLRDISPSRGGSVLCRRPPFPSTPVGPDPGIRAASRKHPSPTDASLNWPSPGVHFRLLPEDGHSAGRGRPDLPLEGEMSRSDRGGCATETVPPASWRSMSHPASIRHHR